ncbi:MAG: acetylxylan esterase [Chthoniobacterales bacterium]
MSPYSLPDLLVDASGGAIDTAEKWKTQRRPELLRLFERHVYGRSLPGLTPKIHVLERTSGALNGQATRMQVQLRFSGHSLELVVYLPNHHTGPVPCFLGLNFHGNHTAFDDPEVRVSTAWVRNDGPDGVTDNRATEAGRGGDSSRWPLEMILARGYALATMYYGDLEPDYEKGFTQGIRSQLFSIDNPQGDDAGAISAWAWGLSRAMDFLSGLPEINSTRICLTGHSRLGKTALWASACDPRFALVVANNSGCGGGALSRRNFGETLRILSRVRPHWFCENCRRNSSDIDSLPVDQHMLIALSAPRPVLLSCAADDLSADPFGEFLAAKNALPAWQLLGCRDLSFPETMPSPNQPPLSRVGYYLRPGPHDITAQDWKVHLDFADRYFGVSDISH